MIENCEREGILTTVHRMGNMLDCLLFLLRCADGILLFKEISNEGWDGRPIVLRSMVKDSEKKQNHEQTNHPRPSPIHGDSSNFLSQSFHLRNKLLR